MAATAIFNSSPLRKELVKGSNWTEQDLNKFGIQYSLKSAEPSEIFKMIQPHIPSTLGIPGNLQSEMSDDSSLSRLKKHTTMLQRCFDETLDLDVDCFELLEMIEFNASRPTGSSVSVSETAGSSVSETGSSVSEKAQTCHCQRQKNAADDHEKKKYKEIGQKIFMQISRVKTRLQLKRSYARDSLMVDWIPTYERIETFLTRLISVLKKASSVNLEINEGTFVGLFQDFAKMFLVHFNVTGIKRMIKMGGMNVISVNDLQYDHEDHEFESENPTIVATIAEVKKTAKKRTSFRTRKLRMSKLQKTEERDDVGRGTRDDNGDECLDDDDDDPVDLSSKLRGQLGIELLADIERSCLKVADNKHMILGLTVEATLVRLACLQIGVDDLKKIKEKLPQDNPSHVASIYYTEAYDMLRKDGRRMLIYIMRYLLFLSDDPFVNLWPRLL